MCVREWVAKEGIISLVSLTGIRVSKGSPLSTLARRPHKELCLRKPARPEEKKRVSQLGVRPRSNQYGAEKQSVRRGGSDIAEVRSKTPKWLVGSETLKTKQ